MKYSALPLFTLLLVMTCGTATAFASPSTVPPDELVMPFDQDFQFADSEFLPDRTTHYGRTPSGPNTAAIHAFSVGAIFAFPNAVGR